MRVQEIICDKCQKKITPDDVIEWQEVLSYRTVGGYGSVWGDGNEVELDLCQSCAKEVVGPYIRTVGSGRF